MTMMRPERNATKTRKVNYVHDPHIVAQPVNERNGDNSPIEDYFRDQNPRLDSCWYSL